MLQERELEECMDQVSTSPDTHRGSILGPPTSSRAPDGPADFSVSAAGSAPRAHLTLQRAMERSPFPFKSESQNGVSFGLADIFFIPVPL